MSTATSGTNTRRAFSAGRRRSKTCIRICPAKNSKQTCSSRRGKGGKTPICPALKNLRRQNRQKRKERWSKVRLRAAPREQSSASFTLSKLCCILVLHEAVLSYNPSLF